MRTLKLAVFVCMSMLGFSCNNDDNYASAEQDKTIHKLSPFMQIVRDYVPNNAVIGHRGTSYWAPESTEAAYRWARNIGADYLEADLQITKDGVILVVHDDVLTRTTNIKDVYPDRATNPTSSFTYEELLQLDAGSWFNIDPNTTSDRARNSFSTQKQPISTLEDLVMFASGYRFVRDAKTNNVVYIKDANGIPRPQYEIDPQDNLNRPGIYIETKEPKLNPGIEQALVKELDRLGWNIITNPANDTAHFINGKVNIGNTNGKVVLQTFSHESLLILKSIFQGKIPTALLFWKGSGADDINDDSPSTYIQHINFAVDNMAHFAGPSIAGGTPPDNWPELLNPWQAELIHKSYLKIHPYSFDNKDQMVKYSPYCEGMFTNQSDMTIQYYRDQGLRSGGSSPMDAKTVLDNLGY
ncbi:glycerophosphodiester phosphodiesterase family protein [Apibacter sp. HY039]|uniref:glycerophosphodiester phosphodiesterase family protein n=1 Tax=Apibacter sp. HY039 TaxID=2501476 RepID=UPI000FEB7289|nr:glycerophosphodiester phosphodiesterase family protein [Apibacter sp. HY039]